MNIRNGYRMTEAGEIPEEWDEITLGELGAWYGGGTPSKAKAEYWINGTIFWVSSQDVKQKYIHTTDNLITERAVKESSSKLTKPDSLIMVMRSGILKHTFPVAIAPFPVAINQDIKVLSPHKDISTEYVYAYLKFRNRDIVCNLVKTGTTVESVEYDQLKKFPIALPPPVEQHKIADILSTVDEHIIDTESLLNKTQVLKKGLMQRLLTKGIRHTEFKDTEIGRIPVEWEVVPFSKYVFFQEGPGLRNWQYTESGIPFINIRCLKSNAIDNKSIQYISFEEFELKYKHFALDIGDIVVSSSGTLGKKAIIKSGDLPIMLNTSIIRIRSKEPERLYFGFLNYYIESEYYQKAVILESTGSAQPNYGPYHLNRIMMLLPPLSEQHQIASILTTIDDQIDAYQTKLTTLTKLKSALMQQLLTGKIRVKV